MFRVYDKRRKKFITEDVLVNQNGELYQVGQKLLGNKMTLLHQDRYVFQQAINLFDKNDTPIYMGDYVKARVSEDREISGLVTFAQELSSYVILCFDSDEYFTLGTGVSEFIEVDGNVFDDLKQR